MGFRISVDKRKSLSRRLYSIGEYGLGNEVMWLGGSFNIRTFGAHYPEYHRVIFKASKDELPLLINDKDEVVREVASWKLSQS